MFAFRAWTCALGAAYVWSLPLLARAGFAQRGATTVSAFIANPPATGAMAALSFTSLALMWEYQDLIVKSRADGRGWVYSALARTLGAFQTFYGAFLVCTYGYVPTWLHTLTVVAFCASFLAHASVVTVFVQPSRPARALLAAGMGASGALLALTAARSYTLWYWFCECIGLTAIFLFTPLEWALILRARAAAAAEGGAPSATASYTHL